jgi:NAD(P)-dependent dehydrogenase (short-subunit alcohol dehydrogenase family)
MFEPNLLQQKRVLITGGDTGLGKSIGRRMMKLGAELMICGRRAQVLKDTAKELEDSFYRRVRTHVIDIRTADAVEGLMDAAFDGGPLDVLVNNAAGNFIARTETLSHRAVDSILNIVLHGAAYCTLSKRWIGQGQMAGSSSASSLPMQGPVHRMWCQSAMAKAGVLGMAKSLAVEWGERGIRAVAICLSSPRKALGTGWCRHRRPNNGRTLTPLGRAGEHHELANLAAYPALDQAGFINGEWSRNVLTSHARPFRRLLQPSTA